MVLILGLDMFWTPPHAAPLGAAGPGAATGARMELEGEGCWVARTVSRKNATSTGHRTRHVATPLDLTIRITTHEATSNEARARVDNVREAAAQTMG